MPTELTGIYIPPCLGQAEKIHGALRCAITHTKKNESSFLSFFIIIIAVASRFLLRREIIVVSGDCRSSLDRERAAGPSRVLATVNDKIRTLSHLTTSVARNKTERKHSTYRLFSALVAMKRHHGGGRDLRAREDSGASSSSSSSSSFFTGVPATTPSSSSSSPPHRGKRIPQSDVAQR